MVKKLSKSCQKVVKKKKKEEKKEKEICSSYDLVAPGKKKENRPENLLADGAKKKFRQ
jgi:hypothetical protein